MDPSSVLCRTQENYHRERVANASLPNVQIVSAKATIAWGLEALAAERREERRDRTRIIAEWTAIEKLRSCEIGERFSTENPDRGFANP